MKYLKGPLRALFFAVAAIGLLATLGTAASGQEGGGYELATSSSPNRSNSSDLDGASLDGDAFVFVTPDNGISNVQFFIDGSNSPVQTERFTPYDLGGTTRGGDAAPFDTDNIGDGSHSVRAVIALTNGSTETVTADFVVGDDNDNDDGNDNDDDGNNASQIEGALRAVNAASFEVSNSGHPPTNVIDGNFNSHWESNGEDRNVFIDLGSVQEVQEIGVAWYEGDGRVYDFELRATEALGGDWELVFRGQSTGDSEELEVYEIDDVDARFVRVKVFSNNESDTQGVLELAAFDSEGNAGNDGNRDGGDDDDDDNDNDNDDNDNDDNDNDDNDNDDNDGDDDDDVNDNDNGDRNDGRSPPQDNFDLRGWALDTPAGRTGNSDISERIEEDEYDDISNASARFFYTAPDGGMRFETRIGGAKTSTNTKFVRSELREMLRRGDKSIGTRDPENNWALGYQPGGGDQAGRNGVLEASLRINKVTTTGDGIQVGRTIIGQIHAASDEPLRLYYRKDKDDTHGCIYASHEIRDSDRNDVDFDIIGNEDCNDPSNGIELNELFSYEIINDDELIIVRIRRGNENGPIIGQTVIDMDEEDSGYDRSDEWMYFKAGAYTQNDTGDSDDGDIITFYRLEASHGNN